jgi:UPF0271 protein
MRPELNIDLGEWPGEPEELFRLAHRVNIACGGHAGDRASIEKACALACAAGAKVGAHVSYPDRANFGRVRMEISDEHLRRSLEEQCHALRAASTRILYLKPHGALYHAANASPELARLVIESCARALAAPHLEIVGPPRGELGRVAKSLGLRFLSEGFADRGYDAAGHLLPRGTPGALLESPMLAAAQASRLRKEGLFQTLCCHSDTPNALAIVRAVRAAIDATELEPAGDTAWRFELPFGTSPAAALAALRDLPRVVDAVVADGYGLVRFAPGEPPDDPRNVLASLEPRPLRRHHHVIRVRYDGPDLDEVANLAGLTREALIAQHVSDPSYEVEMIGFLPGFAYLGPVPPVLNVPRRKTPRLRVPAGAVGLAAGRTAVYPFESPGGWNLIGTAVDFKPFTFELGDHVQFEAVS